MNNLEYQDWQFELDVVPKQPSPVKAENFLFVQDLETFQTLLTELRSADIKEIAIDLEHHSYHSYQGFTCLMQLSTRTKDYIIDTLALRDNLQDLNEVNFFLFKTILILSYSSLLILKLLKFFMVLIWIFNGFKKILVFIL